MDTTIEYSDTPVYRSEDPSDVVPLGLTVNARGEQRLRLHPLRRRQRDELRHCPERPETLVPPLFTSHHPSNRCTGIRPPRTPVRVHRSAGSASRAAASG
ncbi:hypothetical protein STRTUCAR8_03550 [Streptomyces turgidiscabies Car8]|uniref:Uncharacterized protein n=1 Tax=Streptomyces turgidiscabies (strain Car8) TaxID=698760 RepID=L7FA84_STRT8|nr:hypothetical protein STRTUCAR8_03550 [Streptomyces turgidiscabies Car8]